MFWVKNLNSNSDYHGIFGDHYSSTEKFKIGRSYNSPDRYFDGYIRDFRVYSRSLVNNEINIIYNLTNYDNNTLVSKIDNKLYSKGGTY